MSMSGLTDSPYLFIAAENESLVARVKPLSERLGIPMFEQGLVEDTSRCEAPLLLYLTEEGIKLQPTGKKAPGATWVDFTSGAVAHRRKYGGGSGQMIAKAVGIKSGLRPSVLDATAGLGKDSFVLATLGCQVQMIERSPVIHLLLEDGLHRAMLDASVLDICERMTLRQGNSADVLRSIEVVDRPQVVYLDPMFPHSEKSALVKKEMRIFRDIVGDDLDSADLLKAALETAKARVVVKRPRKAPIIDGVAPSYAITGKSSRYDIYALKKLS